MKKKKLKTRLDLSSTKGWTVVLTNVIKSKRTNWLILFVQRTNRVRAHWRGTKHEYFFVFFFSVENIDAIYVRISVQLYV